MTDTVTLPLNPTDDPVKDAALLVLEVMKHFYLNEAQKNKVLRACMELETTWQTVNTSNTENIRQLKIS